MDRQSEIEAMARFIAAGKLTKLPAADDAFCVARQLDRALERTKAGGSTKGYWDQAKRNQAAYEARRRK